MNTPPRREAMPPSGKSVVLVGLMGAGKSSIGARMARKLDLPFADADTEIEEAAGCSITEIFERFGERSFRDGERRVISRLLGGEVKILATGGGAFVDPETRALIASSGISIWLRAGLDLLIKRTSRRNNRPLLKTGNARDIMKKLMDERYPLYAGADITVEVIDEAPDKTTDRVLGALSDYTRLDAGPVSGPDAGAAT